MKNHFVHTPCGPVQGAAGGADGVSVFRGIRYATAGRWEYPRQVTHWDGVCDAANFGACSFQPRAFYNNLLSHFLRLSLEHYHRIHDYEGHCS